MEKQIDRNHRQQRELQMAILADRFALAEAVYERFGTTHIVSVELDAEVMNVFTVDGESTYLSVDYPNLAWSLAHPDDCGVFEIDRLNNLVLDMNMKLKQVVLYESVGEAQ